MSTITLRDAALLSNQVNYQSLIESSNNTQIDSYDDYRTVTKRVTVNNSAIPDYTHALRRSPIVHLRSNRYKTQVTCRSQVGRSAGPCCIDN